MQESGMHGAVETGDDLVAFGKFVVHPKNDGSWVALELRLLDFLETHVEDGRGCVLLYNAKVGVRHKEHFLLPLVDAELTNGATGMALYLQKGANLRI